MGRFTLDVNTDNPFVIADGYMEEIREKIILVDFHAEGTSEKRAMGFLRSREHPRSALKR